MAPAEPNALPTEVVDNIEMPLPSNPQTFFLGSLLTLAVLAAVYVASPIILPVVLAFVLQLILQPAVHLLERVHLPRAIGALFAILLVIGALVGFVAALSSARRDVGGEVAGASHAWKPTWSS
jgi:predicted PurR-regulated permease PerM